MLKSGSFETVLYTYHKTITQKAQFITEGETASVVLAYYMGNSQRCKKSTTKKVNNLSEIALV